jgi:hypothetical protein
MDSAEWKFKMVAWRFAAWEPTSDYITLFQIAESVEHSFQLHKRISLWIVNFDKIL